MQARVDDAIEAFGPLSSSVRAAAEAAARSYEAMLDTPLTVTFASVGTDD